MANVKFSQFIDQVTLSPTGFLVGYDGAVNVRLDMQSLSDSFADYTVSVDSVKFDLAPTASPGAGQIAYQGTTGTLSYNLNSSNVRCDIGQQMYAYVHNAEAVQINKGQAVYLFGASGNKASVKLANNTGDATSAKTLGLAAEDIPAGQNGMVICQGVIEGVSTTGFPDGTSLYLGPTAGSVTSTKPYAPNHLVYIGTVEIGNHANNGKIYVRVQNGYELDEIHDVDLITTPPANNDVLTYVTGANNLWKARSIPTILGYTPQNKSIAAYSMLVNNTNAAADMTTTNYKTGSGAYSGAIAWTGTTAPSGATDHTFRWQWVGNVVTLQVTLFYAVAGSALTQVVFELPSGAPTPSIPSSLSGNSSVLYPGSGHMTGTLTLSANAARSALITNSTNTGFSLIIAQVSGAYKNAQISVTYFTA